MFAYLNLYPVASQARDVRCLVMSLSVWVISCTEMHQESSISEAEAYVAKPATNWLGNMGCCGASHFTGCFTGWSWLFSVCFCFLLAKFVALQDRHTDRQVIEPPNWAAVSRNWGTRLEQGGRGWGVKIAPNDTEKMRVSGTGDSARPQTGDCLRGLSP